MEVNFKYNFRGYFRFYYSILGNKIYLFLLLNVLVGLLDGIGLALIVPLFSSLFGAGNEGLLNTGKMHYIADLLSGAGIPLTITNTIFVVILVFSIKGLFRFLQMRYSSRIRFLFIRELRVQLLYLLNTLSYTGFLKLNAGKIQNALTTEISGLYYTLTAYLSTLQCVGILITYFTLACITNLQFAIMVLVFGATSNLLYRKLFSKTQKISANVSKESDTFISYLIQSITHYRYLKATNYFKRYLGKLKKVIEEIEQLNFRMGFFSALSEGIKEPVAIVMISLILGLQFYLFPESDKNAILVCLLLFYRSLAQLGQLQTSWQFFAQNAGSIRSVTGLIRDVQQSKEPAPENLPELSEVGEIRLTEVSVAYTGRTILEQISLRIPRHRTVAFVGESGSGKTTLAHVIIGLITPTTGTVSIGNSAIGEISLDAYRDKIGYIAQDPVVFSDTIFNNVTFFDAPTPENQQRFQKAVQQASLDGFIDTLPEKEHTQVGDNGIYISGGQKQRLSIARELYKNVEVLILDEATSALDSATENIIQKSLELLHGHCTIIIIAHRLATIKMADAIFLIKNKTITAQGTFDALKESSEDFRQMIAAQRF
ncbi:MAG: ABC transporter ATP-binding protein [Niabella sp.]|nr:ABC transporter ATP-binding protein [Niabella sp.]